MQLENLPPLIEWTAGRHYVIAPTKEDHWVFKTFYDRASFAKSFIEEHGVCADQPVAIASWDGHKITVKEYDRYEHRHVVAQYEFSTAPKHTSVISALETALTIAETQGVRADIREAIESTLFLARTADRN